MISPMPESFDLPWDCQEPKLKTFRAIELSQIAIRETKWAVEQLVPEGLSVLASPPKSGKSFFVLQMGIAVASGEPFLNLETSQGKVLYCALEDSLERIRSRLNALFKEQSNLPESLYIFVDDLPRLDDGGISVLGEWIGFYDPRLVILDTWGRVKPANKTRGENAYEADVRIVSEVKRLADRHECSILLVHHLRKGGSRDADWLESLSGSMGLGGTADGILSLVRDRGSKQAILKRSGRDFEEEDDMALEWLSPGWKYSGNPEDLKMSAERKAIVALIAEAGEPVPCSFVAQVLGKNFHTTKSLIRKMARAGILRSTSKGEYSLASDYEFHP